MPEDRFCALKGIEFCPPSTLPLIRRATDFPVISKTSRLMSSDLGIENVMNVVGLNGLG